MCFSGLVVGLPAAKHLELEVHIFTDYEIVVSICLMSVQQRVMGRAIFLSIVEMFTKRRLSVGAKKKVYI